MKLTNYKKYIFLGLYVLGIILSFYSSLENATSSSNTSLNVTKAFIQMVKIITFNNVVLEKEIAHTLVRKLVGHFGTFCFIGINGYIMYYLFFKGYKKAIIMNLFVGLVIAVISELLQLLSEGRSCEVRDMLIDFSGIVVTTFICYLVKHLYKKKNLKKEE